MRIRCDWNVSLNKLIQRDVVEVEECSDILQHRRLTRERGWRGTTDLSGPANVAMMSEWLDSRSGGWIFTADTIAEWYALLVHPI